ncbi:MAG: penicillin acylase family protein [Granulicella sp.]
MASYDPHPPDFTANELDPAALGRRHAVEAAANAHRNPPAPAGRRRFHRPQRLLRSASFILIGLIILSSVGYFASRHWLRAAVRDSLPQIDGSVSLPGLSAPVTVQRDGHGVPHLRAASLDDLILAQGYVTTQDRLWQMEALRRHASGTLAEILGSGLVEHDRTQRVLQLRAAADRAVAVLPTDQLHWLELYARGVNASIDAQRSHLPVEFRLLGFAPAPWTPRDSLLVGLAMFQDLTNSFPTKLGREAIAAKLSPEMLADLYPVGSWRDHPVVQPAIDLTTPVDEIEQIPLDESQSKLELTSPQHIQSLLDARANITPVVPCEDCRAGSNNWVVSGVHSATGKPLLSNDMHLSHSLPGIWYEADLKAPSPSGEFHVAGLSLPGTPFIIVGHNDHVAWGFTNLGADVQDLTIEHLRGSGSSAQFQAADGSWQPVVEQHEIIRVKHGRDITLDIPETRHGSLTTPIISSLYHGEKRNISLSWTIYDPANVTLPFFDINNAADGTALVAAFSTFGGPAQNMVYADDQGHIGYHAIGRIPVRGDLFHPTPLQPAPADASIAANEWAGYIPFSELPQVVDPPGGLLATANARIAPDNFPYPITLNWSAPYRNERIWKILTGKNNLTPADMLGLQVDIYSDLDRVVAQRLAYAIDHAQISGNRQKRLHVAADLLRNWSGSVDANAAAPAIVDATRTELWQLLLEPKLGAATKLYSWGEKSYAEEQLIVHAPARWLPSGYTSWDNLLADAVDKALTADHAPSDLANWRYGVANPVDIEHPVLSSTPLIAKLLGLPVGTGPRPQSGDGSTIKQVGRTFGPSERFTADLADLDHSTLNIVLGQSGNLASPWFMDQFFAWYTGKTFSFPYTDAAVQAATTHTLTLTPQ